MLIEFIPKYEKWTVRDALHFARLTNTFCTTVGRVEGGFLFNIPGHHMKNSPCTRLPLPPQVRTIGCSDLYDPTSPHQNLLKRSARLGRNEPMTITLSGRDNITKEQMQTLVTALQSAGHLVIKTWGFRPVKALRMNKTKVNDFRNPSLSVFLHDTLCVIFPPEIIDKIVAEIYTLFKTSRYAHFSKRHLKAFGLDNDIRYLEKL